MKLQIMLLFLGPLLWLSTVTVVWNAVIIVSNIWILPLLSLIIGCCQCNLSLWEVVITFSRHGIRSLLSLMGFYNYRLSLWDAVILFWLCDLLNCVLSWGVVIVVYHHGMLSFSKFFMRHS